jgi:hypothetical protein
MGLISTIIAIGTPIVKKELLEVVKNEITGEFVEKKTGKTEIDKPKTVAKSTAILSFISAGVYALSVFGVIPPEIAEAMNTILTSEQTAAALEKLSD